MLFFVAPPSPPINSHTHTHHHHRSPPITTPSHPRDDLCLVRHFSSLYMLSHPIHSLSLSLSLSQLFIHLVFTLSTRASLLFSPIPRGGVFFILLIGTLIIPVILSVAVQFKYTSRLSGSAKGVLFMFPPFALEGGVVVVFVFFLPASHPFSTNWSRGEQPMGRTRKKKKKKPKKKPHTHKTMKKKPKAKETPKESQRKI